MNTSLFRDFSQNLCSLKELWDTSIILSYHDMLPFPRADISQESAWDSELRVRDGKMKGGDREEEGRREKEDENKMRVFDKRTNL